MRQRDSEFGGEQMGADALSDLLRAVRLTGAVFFNVEVSSPWVAEAPPAKILAPLIMPGAQHLIEYHVMTSGRCWGGVVGTDAIELQAGDVVVFPHGDAHVLSSAPGMRAEPNMDLYRDPGSNQLPFFVKDGGGGEAAHLVCGFLGCDAYPFNPLLDALPRMLCAREMSADSGSSLGHLARLALVEATDKRAGGEGVLACLSELMFIEVIRRYLESLPPEQTGWLAGLRDRFVGRALSLLHARPGHAWTLDELSREVGLSRSALAERFTHFVGRPPMQYLARWRIQIATGLLSNGERIAGVAERVGYESQAAFSRAFKKAVGISPAAWRGQARSN
jgi:AraC-like DNA-binding protein